MNGLTQAFGGFQLSSSSSSFSVPKRVSPLPHQEEWFRRIVQLFLAGELILIDTSSMGCGKTFGPLWAAQSLGVPLFVVGPAGSYSTWVPTCQKYGISLVDYVSYSALAGTETRGTGNSPWFVRGDFRADDKVNGALGARTTIYSVTSRLEALIQQGVIFAFDEFQSVTSGGGNTYLKASQTIMDTLRAYPHRSRAMFLSGTPFKKEKEVLTFLPLLGCYTPTTDMIGPKKRGKETLSFRERIEDKGLGEIYRCAARYNVALADKIIDDAIATKKMQNAKLAKEIAVDLYVQIISKNIGGFMEPIKSDKYKCHFYNLYAPLCSSSYAAMNRAIDAFQKEVFYNEETGLIERPPGKGFGEDVMALQAIHSGLLESLYVQVRKQLLEKPNTKALLFTYYLHCIEELCYLFGDEFPIETISGDSKPATRQQVADRFRFPGGPRILISNGSVGAVGLSMHSVTPGLEIYAYSLPFWNIIMCHQQTGRIFRADENGIVNDAYFHIHYPPREQAVRIQRINNALTESATFMEKSIGGIDAASLPGRYADKVVL